MTTEVNISATARWGSIVLIWVVAAVCVVAIAIFSPVSGFNSWLGLTLGGCAVLSLCVQLATQQKTGFVDRLAASLVGALAVVGLGAAVLWAVAR